MKKTTIQIIAELKQKQHLQQIWKQQTNDLDNYFPNSGRIEYKKRFKIVQQSNF